MLLTKTFTMCAAIAAVLCSNAVVARAATPVAQQDAAFAIKAAQGGQAEVADASIALQTSRNPNVDKFANRMVDDHSKANKQLAVIMHQEHLAPPATIGAENQTVNTRLQGLVGRAFDVEYFADQRTAHKETIALFTREIQTGKDPRLVMFAKKTLPVVKMHLAMLAHLAPS